MKSSVGPEVNIYKEGTNIIDPDKLRSALEWWFGVFKEQVDALAMANEAYSIGAMTEDKLLETMHMFGRYAKTNQDLLEALKTTTNT